MKENNVMAKIMDYKDLQNYQDIFCEAQRVFLMCYNSDRKSVTFLSGRSDEVKMLYEFIGKEELENNMLHAINDAIDEKKHIWRNTMYENIKIVGIPIRINDKCEGAWALVVVYKEELYEGRKDILPTNGCYGKVSFNGAKRTIRLIEIFSQLFIATAYDNNKIAEKLKEISEKDSRIKEELKRKEITNRLLKYLDRDEEIEKIIDDVIGLVNEYIGLSLVIIAEVNEEGKVNTIGKWRDSNFNCDDLLEEKLLSDVIPYYNGSAILTIEPDTDNEVLKSILDKYDLKSLISVPIATGKGPAIHAVFAEGSYDRYWDSNTVTFLFDVCKMIQTFIYKRNSKNSLVSSYTALKEILNNISCGVFVVDKESKEILFCNNVMMNMTGMDLIGQHCYDYFYGGIAPECEWCNPHSHSCYSINKYDEKRERWYEVQYNDITWVDGKEVSLCSINDVTDKKKYQQRIEFQANNDFLTGLYNRMRCEEDLQLLVTEAEQTHRVGALLFIDLDDFKHINDGLGHQYGDALLKMIAGAFKEIKGIENRCYRVGGDEFIIIIEPEHYDMYKEIIVEIQKAFSCPWYLGKNEYYCTMSMGIVTFPDNGRDVNDLIKKADIAMYDAKKNGKNGYRLYSEGEDENKYIQLDIEKNIRSSVAAGCGEFEVYIQPIVDISNEKCIGGEALVRWNSEELGFLMPADFIPLAEHLGLISNIGDYVLKYACSLSRKWSDMGINARINVNLSVIQLLDNNIVENIKKIIEEIKVVPSNLVLEVTESLAINDMNRMKKIIKQIKELGVKIALDDFGTGYSSLNYIKQMDLDIIKVDRTFIKDISDDDYAQAFVKLIAELSKKLEVQVCVEGVEDKTQLDTLKTMNINMIQGFYYGCPMKVEEFEKKFLGIKV